MRLNNAATIEKKYTHEGARAADHVSLTMQLRRSVMACLLWEDGFYESGEEVARRIQQLVTQVPAESVAQIAVEARTKMKLRHVPLLLACSLAKLPSHRHVVADLLAEVIQRPDELTETLAIYQKLNERTGVKKLNRLSHQVQRGLARAFGKFNEYQLAKYNRESEIKLRDVLFLTHPKPVGEGQEDLWSRLINNQLMTPDTWEVELSASKDKRASWTRLLEEGKLGALALLRNLRNMKEAGVEEGLIREALMELKAERVLPFRFIAAARYAPQWEPELEQAMFRCVADAEKLPGKTVIIVDNSCSMYGTKVSAKSDMDRSDAACVLAILVREVCDQAAIISFSTHAVPVPPRRGFALRDAIKSATEHGGTNTDNALALAAYEGYDRVIVITDEQSHQAIRLPRTGSRGYFINVATDRNGIGYGPWTHIDGWSEAVVDYIRLAEQA